MEDCADAYRWVVDHAEAYGGDLDRERVESALRKAGAWGFVSSMKGGIDSVATLVEHGPDAPVVHPAHEGVTHAERAALHEHGDDRSLPDIELGLDDHALRLPIRICL